VIGEAGTEFLNILYKNLGFKALKDLAEVHSAAKIYDEVEVA
jgi:hypothetical protein